MKKLLITAMMALTTGAAIQAVPPARGVPAVRTPIELTQPDGYVLISRLHGDERLHWRTTDDGWRITQKEDGYYYYTVIDREGKKVAGRRVARNEADRSRCEKRYLNKKGQR